MPKRAFRSPAMMPLQMPVCFVLGCVVFIAFYAMATHAASAGWSDTGYVTEINPTDKHFYQFRLSGLDNANDCKQENGFYQDYKKRGAEKIYSTLLTAMTAGLPVRVFATGGCNLKGYAEISQLIVVKPGGKN